MKRSVLLLSLLITALTFSQGVNVNLKESDVYKLSTARVQNDYILPDNKGGFITVSSKRSGFLIDPVISESYTTFFDKNMQIRRSKTFKLNKGNIKGSIKGAFVNNNHLYLINLEQNLRDKFYSFKVIDQNIDTGETNTKEFFHLNFLYPKNEVNLFVNPGSLYYQKLQYYSDVNFFNPKIFIRFSKNNNYFAIVYRDQQKKPTKYHIHVFNRNFKELYNQEIVDKTPSKLLYINDLQVDNQNGEVFLATQIFRSNPLKEKRILNNDITRHFTVYRIDRYSVKHFQIKPKKVIDKIQLKLDNENVIVYGFYRNNFLEINDIDGFFRLNLSKEMVELNQSYKNFKKKLVAVGTKKHYKKTKNHTIVIRQSILLPNGDMIVNAEDLYIPLMMKGRNRETTIREIVGDLFNVKVAANGDILRVRKIHKKQFVKPRLALHSFFSTYQNGKEYLLFTDSTLEKPSGNVPFYKKGSELKNLNTIKISDNDGSIEKHLIPKPEKSKFNFIPIECTMIGPNTAVIPAKDHDNIKYYRINFK